MILSIFFKICSLVICMSLEKCLLKSFSVCSLGCSFCRIMVVILYSDSSPLSDMWFVKIFSHSIGHFFYILESFFWGRNAFNLTKYSSSVFFLLLMSYLRNHCLVQDHKDYTLFSSKSFVILDIIYVFDPFLVIFCIIYKIKVQLHCFASKYSVVSEPCVER